jgi:hypothetical protein
MLVDFGIWRESYSGAQSKESGIWVAGCDLSVLELAAGLFVATMS